MKSKSMKKCVIYSRVSTDHQSNESSIKDLENFCSKNELEVCKIFEETTSGYVKNLSKSEQRKRRIKEEESKWEELKSFIKQNEIKEIICYELSRLGRTTSRTLTWIEELQKEGVNIYFKKENINTLSDEPTTKLLITTLSSIADFEGHTIKARTKRGMKESAKAGKRIGYGKMPLGYSVDENKFIIINQQEADLVSQIYKEAASGISAPIIANKLNKKKIPTYNDKNGKVKVLRNGLIRQSEWNPKTIKNIIRSTRYKGYREFGKRNDGSGNSISGEIIKVPRIVSDEIWEEANFKINEHIGYLSSGIKYDYLFKSKITCGQCGYTLKALRKYSRKGDDKKHKDVLYYTCQSYLHTHLNCDCGRFRSEIFDRFLYDDLFESGRGIFISMNKDQYESRRIELDKALEYWNQKKLDLTDEKKKIRNLYVKGYISEKELDKDMSGLVAKTNEAIEEIAHAEQALNNLRIVNNLSIKELHKQYFICDFNTRRDFVEQFVQRIKVYKVDRINHDLTKVHQIKFDWSDKITPAHTTKFVNPKKNEVIWYVELWAFNEIEPMKILMTSSSGTNLVNANLHFDKNSRSISIDP